MDYLDKKAMPFPNPIKTIIAEKVAMGKQIAQVDAMILPNTKPKPTPTMAHLPSKRWHVVSVSGCCAAWG